MSSTTNDSIEVSRAKELRRDARGVAGPARRGQRGGMLWAVSTKDGKPLAKYNLDSPPVFDGMAATVGRVYMATTDGRVVCFSN